MASPRAERRLGLALLLGSALWRVLRPAPAGSRGRQRPGWDSASSEPSRARIGIAKLAAAGLGLLVALAVAGGGLVWARQEREWASAARVTTGGDPGRAVGIMIANGCAGCHTIPGVPGARGLVGPDLRGIARRLYLGGSVPNTPENMIRWIRTARQIDPNSAMPDTLLSEPEARDVAAYLYTLR
ncbi:MAG TPA: c-type cytochrome [Myxococcota bacterium]|nr:c-type cytochrome [Myxococcota bacterium]